MENNNNNNSGCFWIGCILLAIIVLVFGFIDSKNNSRRYKEKNAYNDYDTYERSNQYEKDEAIRKAIDDNFYQGSDGKYYPKE